MAPAPDVRTGAARLDAYVEVELLAQVRHLAAVAQVDADRAVERGILVAAKRPLDPGLLLADERLDVAERHAARHDDLDPIGVDDDARVAGAVRAADSVLHLALQDMGRVRRSGQLTSGSGPGAVSDSGLPATTSS